MEPPTEVEQREKPSETPGNRLIPPREAAPISPISPTHDGDNSSNSINTAAMSGVPPVPERNSRRSMEGFPEQRPLSIPVQQPQEPYGPSQQPGQGMGMGEYTTNSPFPPSRQSTLRETPGAGSTPMSAHEPVPSNNYQIPRKQPPGSKTFDNLKRAAAGVHVSLFSALLSAPNLSGDGRLSWFPSALTTVVSIGRQRSHPGNHQLIH